MSAQGQWQNLHLMAMGMWKSSFNSAIKTLICSVLSPTGETTFSVCRTCLVELVTKLEMCWVIKRSVARLLNSTTDKKKKVYWDKEMYYQANYAYTNQVIYLLTRSHTRGIENTTNTVT